MRIKASEGSIFPGRKNGFARAAAAWENELRYSQRILSMGKKYRRAPAQRPSAETNCVTVIWNEVRISGVVTYKNSHQIFLMTVTFYKKEYESDVNTYAKMYSLDVDLVYAVINTESGFNVNAKSKAGAMGLMQLLPTTAKDVAIRIGMEYSEDMLFRPNTNIHLGCYYLKYLIDMFGSVELVLASYNAGLSYVRSWLKDSRYSGNGAVEDEPEEY